MKSTFQSAFGYTHPDRDKREMCPYCYDEDTQRIVDVLDLKPFSDYHGKSKFKAFRCTSCNATWHWRE